MTKIDQNAQRITELEDLAAAEGLALPMPAPVIALHEQAGHVVDLYSGHLVTDGGEARYSPAPALLEAGGAFPERGTEAAWAERWQRQGQRSREVAPDLRTADERARDDVAGLRRDLERLAETVRLTTGPVDVALQVDAQRNDVAQLKLRIENLLDVCEAQEARLRKLEQRLVELEDHVWDRPSAHVSSPTADQALLRNLELCAMFDAQDTR